MTKRRVKILHKLKCPLGKGVVIHENECLTSLIERLNDSVFPDYGIKCLRTIDNAEITDIDFIRDEDILIIEKEDDIFHSDWVNLNVGGKKISTNRSTLTRIPDSVLAKMFDERMVPSLRDQEGAYLWDRSAFYFEPILNYLRTGKLILDPGINPGGVYEEANYFGIIEILPELEGLLLEKNKDVNHSPLSRRNVIAALMTTSSNSELRFQGLNFTGADLSKLDLRNINFKYANLSKCHLSGSNLSGCNLERADLSYSILDGATIQYVKMMCANCEGASLKNCNFEDPSGTGAVMEGANLKGATLEESNMAGANLRVATLKHGNMRNCNLRGASLAGADLEFCDLSGSDLHEANLRGANLKDTSLELMLTPLHMSQTIR